MGPYYFRLECVRMLRDPRYLALAVIAPVGFYLLFATLFGGRPATSGGQLPATVEIMVAMAAYGAIWGALAATGPRIAHERAGGWLEQMRAMPLTGRQVMAGRLAAGMVVALPALALVCATGAVVKDVRLSAVEWVTLIGATWLGSLPFALMGVAIGYAVGAETAFPLSYGLYMAMSALGGLWVPPSQLPSSFLHVADALPTFRLADLGWHIAAGHAPTLVDVAVLAAWAAGLGAVAALAHRGPRRVRSVRRAGSGPGSKPDGEHPVAEEASHLPVVGAGA